MFVFDLTNILTLVLVLIATVLFIILSQEVKRGLVVAIPLFGFVLDLVVQDNVLPKSFLPRIIVGLSHHNRQ